MKACTNISDIVHQLTIKTLSEHHSETLWIVLIRELPFIILHKIIRKQVAMVSIQLVLLLVSAASIVIFNRLPIKDEV